MAIKFKNYTHSFELNGKPVFSPSKLGRIIGDDIKSQIWKKYKFKNYYYHLSKGGHVSAMHAHRQNTYFCKVDIENFFYSVGRNRVVRALQEISISRAQHYGKWSCVRNPFTIPSYAIPYGFVQSPVLASLVLATSGVGSFLERISKTVEVSVYVDDVSMSSNSISDLQSAYDELLDAMVLSALKPKAEKCVPPRDSIEIFNCSLTTGKTEVLRPRRDVFYAVPRSAYSISGFEKYCDLVCHGNS